MKVGHRVVFLDDESELNLCESTLATVIAVRSSDHIEIQVGDGRYFTIVESSLGPAPAAGSAPAKTAGAAR